MSARWAYNIRFLFLVHKVETGYFNLMGSLDLMVNSEMMHSVLNWVANKF